jgi:hypothetical protein
MNEQRLIDYLSHMQQAALDACGFIEGLNIAGAADAAPCSPPER